jgi:hypothetical protein
MQYKFIFSITMGKYYLLEVFKKLGVIARWLKKKCLTLNLDLINLKPLVSILSRFFFN